MEISDIKSTNILLTRYSAVFCKERNSTFKVPYLHSNDPHLYSANLVVAVCKQTSKSVNWSTGGTLHPFFALLMAHKGGPLG